MIDWSLPLTVEQAEAVYAILVEHAGAATTGFWKDDFMYHETDRYVDEYRFQGALGFGGKFYRGLHDIGYVGCYREDITLEVAAMLTYTNEALKELSSRL